ncbi:hypothetical protein DQ384_26680 [Sphaerisporangium album]|uniref:DUF916 domain-containing protein n=1 Tax=Sphaerisporangium album TaxID=509200 RepID=A0A367FAK6_9ACTN|nr:hypothetical protein DQ384_26680 [Sphaerisporangium album]
MCLVGAWCPPVLAQARPTPDFSMQVSPTRLVVPAGAASVTQRFRVSNRGAAPFKVTVARADFTMDLSGMMNFSARTPFAAASWVSVEPARFTMAPGTTRQVTVRVAVPHDPEPGDHHLAVLFRVPAGRNAQNIRINRVIAAPVFITVPGTVDRTAGIAGLDAPGFVTRGPVPITTKISDLGTVHRDFRGPQRLRVNVGGDAVDFPDFTVLRGATRQVTTQWNPPLMCVCHATVSVPAPAGVNRTATVRIIVFPLDLLALLASLIVVALTTGWFVRRRYRAKVLAAAAALQKTQEGHHD